MVGLPHPPPPCLFQGQPTDCFQLHPIYSCYYIYTLPHLLNHGLIRSRCRTFPRFAQPPPPHVPGSTRTLVPGSSHPFPLPRYGRLTTLVTRTTVRMVSGHLLRLRTVAVDHTRCRRRSPDRTRLGFPVCYPDVNAMPAGCVTTTRNLLPSPLPHATFYDVTDPLPIVEPVVQVPFCRPTRRYRPPHSYLAFLDRYPLTHVYGGCLDYCPVVAPTFTDLHPVGYAPHHEHPHTLRCYLPSSRIYPRLADRRTLPPPAFALRPVPHHHLDSVCAGLRTATWFPPRSYYGYYVYLLHFTVPDAAMDLLPSLFRLFYGYGCCL